MRKYVYMGGAALVMALVLSLHAALVSRGNLERKWRDAMENVKAYSGQFSDSEGRNRAFKLTIGQLRNSNDSILKELDEARRELKIKDSRLRSLQYVSSDFSKIDTVHWTDTIFRDARMDMDTLVSDEWYSMRIGLRYPSTVIAEPRFVSRKYIVVSTRRETVNPPRKFFLFRWFQKRHTVLNIDVMERNPYVRSQDNRYVEVIK